MDDQLATAAAAYRRATSAEVKAKQRLRDARRDKAAATAAYDASSCDESRRTRSS
jgi:hypothetical protein